MNSVFVFKTSVKSRAAIAKVSPLLDVLIMEGGRWNFDLNDHENILRVEMEASKPADVITALQVAGYECEELQ